VSNKGYVALVDGALFANNPPLEALSIADKLLSKGDPSLFLLSIGTGKGVTRHSFAQAWSWGTLGWLNPLLEIAFSDPAIEYQVSRTMAFKGGTYFRIQPELGENPPPLDASAPGALQFLEDVAQRYVNDPKNKMERIIELLKLRRSADCKPFGEPFERATGPRKRG
jgi:hypothetical protein